MEPLVATICACLTKESPNDWPELPASDWQRLPAVAAWHGVLPLLHRQFSTQGWPATMPAAVRTDIEMRQYVALAESSLLYGPLPMILRAVGNKRPVLVLKGVALGTTLYPDPVLRPLTDIDLLLRHDDIAAATASLSALGFEVPPEASQGLNHLTRQHVVLYGGPMKSTVVELHWRLVSGEADWRSPDIEWFWHETQCWEPDISADLHGLTLLQLTPTAQLLYLAAHLVLQHGSATARLIWLYDIHLLLTIGARAINWDQLVEQATTCRWSPAVAAALAQAKEAFDTSFPEHVLDRLALASDPATRSFIRIKATHRTGSFLANWHGVMALSPRARLKVIWSLLFPRPAHLRWYYAPESRWSWLLLYLYRWLRLGRRAIATLIHLARERLGG